MKKNKAILLIIFLLISTLGISQNEEKEVKKYYENGQLKSIGIKKDGKPNEEWKYYHENGKLKEIGEFENGDAIGIWKSYHENGKLESIGKYIDGIEAGEWKYYDENGKLEDTVKFFDGKQSDNIPPIQKYLDKVINVDMYVDPTKISQKISVNKFIVTLDTKSIKWKETYSEIDWSNYVRYRYNEFKDFIVIEFFFDENIKYNYSDNESKKETEEVASFSCKIWPKDKDAVLEILENWDDTRGY